MLCFLTFNMPFDTNGSDSCSTRHQAWQQKKRTKHDYKVNYEQLLPIQNHKEERNNNNKDP